MKYHVFNRTFLKTIKDISYIKWNNKEGIYSFYIVNDANTDVNGCVLYRNNTGRTLNKILLVFLSG